MCSSAPTEKPGKLALDDERGEFLSVHFGEHDEQVGKTRVRNPHFFAVQQVVLAIARKRSPGAAMERIRSRGRFGKRVGADGLAARQPGQIFLLLRLGAEIHDRQRANAGVGAPGGTEAPILRDAVSNDGRGDFVELHAAVLLGNIDSAQPQFAGLPQQFSVDGELLVLHLFNVRYDFFVGKFFGSLRNQQVLLGEIFRCKHFVWCALLDQETAARYLGSRYFRNCSHILLLDVSVLDASWCSALGRCVQSRNGVVLSNPVFLPQLAFQNFAGPGLRQALEEFDRARTLVVRQPGTAELHEFTLGGFRSGF